MIEIKNVTKTYGSKKALNNISFTVESGEIFAFIGHNGAGKTTLIKALCGIHDFDSGEFLINGASIQKDPLTCKKQLAYVPDDPTLYENMKALDFINFVCDLYEVPEAKRRKNTERLSKLLKLDRELTSPIKSFSHGMKQKVALISALVHEPKVLVMDEPFVGLDPQAIFDLKQLMQEMVQKGATIFFSTHILDMAEKLCTRVAIVKQGKLIEIGTMKQVRGNKSLEKVFLELEA